MPPEPTDPDPIPTGSRLDRLLQSARAERAPADLWPRIAARAQTRRPRRWLASAAALLLGGLSYWGLGYWLAAAALRPAAAHRVDGVHAVVAASWPFLRGTDPGGAPAAEQLLLLRLAAEPPPRTPAGNTRNK